MKRVIIETSCPKISMGKNPARNIVAAVVAKQAVVGVRYLGCTLEKAGGRRPSLPIARKIRDCPSNWTRTTEARPARMAALTKLATQKKLGPIASRATAIGSGTSRSL